jgi:hypothetical protein
VGVWASDGAILPSADQGIPWLSNASRRLGIPPPKSLNGAKCFVPDFDGAFLSSDSKDALWDRFYMGAHDDRAAVFGVKRLEGATACDP